MAKALTGVALGYSRDFSVRLHRDVAVQNFPEFEDVFEQASSNEGDLKHRERGLRPALKQLGDFDYNVLRWRR